MGQSPIYGGSGCGGWRKSSMCSCRFTSPVGEGKTGAVVGVTTDCWLAVVCVVLAPERGRLRLAGPEQTYGAVVRVVWRWYSFFYPRSDWLCDCISHTPLDSCCSVDSSIHTVLLLGYIKLLLRVNAHRGNTGLVKVVAGCVSVHCP